MTKCIYCNEREANSREHYLPACLGSFRNFEQLSGKLCSICNGEIGKLEEQFCRCGPEAFFRIVLGIKGRKRHKKSSPFYRGSGGGKRITIKSKHPFKDCDIFCEAAEGGEDGYPARQVIVIDNKGKYHPVLITEKIKNSEDLHDELETKGLVKSKPVEFWTAGPEEGGWMKSLFEGYNVEIRWRETLPFQKIENQQFLTEFTVNDRYFRAIAKIGFHYLLKHFEQFSGFEKEFDGIKNFIMNGGETDKWIQQMDHQFVEGLKDGKTTNKYLHIITVEKTRWTIIAKLQFFVGPKMLPSPHKVLIGKNPERIDCPETIAYQFLYFDKPDKEGFCGIMQPMHVVRKSLLI